MRDYRAYIGKRFEQPYACLDLVVAVWNDVFQRNIPHGSASDTMAYFRAHLDAVKIPQEGDLILIKAEIWHAGLVISEGHMLHTFPDGTAGIERYDGLKWKSRVRGYYRWTR